jgi:hypothetical protein
MNNRNQTQTNRISSDGRAVRANPEITCSARSASRRRCYLSRLRIFRARHGEPGARARLAFRTRCVRCYIQ